MIRSTRAPVATVMPRFKPVRHDEQLTLVEHLDELRHRLIVSAAVFGVAFGLCFWQSQLLLRVANAPLPDGRVPITFGVTEPFTTTITVCAAAALVLALPVLLYQLYAFALPALSHRERRAILPLLLMIPTLFIAGVAFAYFVVTPAATQFLLHFNDAHFNVQVRARDYYSFLTTTLLAVGIVFQVPVAILALARLGLVTPRQLAKNRRYAYLICAIVAAALPGVDPVTMLIETVPLLLLYELSIVLARLFASRPREPSVQPR
jgi:sec-independent protein translocase protein TatC